MDVTQYDEFRAWTSADDEATVEEKRSALELFCSFHSLDPHQLIVEAQGAEKTGEWLKGYAAEQRIQQFYSHLTTPTAAGGLGRDRETAKACWRRVRSFYTKYGVVTKIEAIASWDPGTALHSLRRAARLHRASEAAVPRYSRTPCQTLGRRGSRIRAETVRRDDSGRNSGETGQTDQERSIPVPVLTG